MIGQDGGTEVVGGLKKSAVLHQPCPAEQIHTVTAERRAARGLAFGRMWADNTVFRWPVKESDCPEKQLDSLERANTGGLRKKRSSP